MNDTEKQQLKDFPEPSRRSRQQSRRPWGQMLSSSINRGFPFSFLALILFWQTVYLSSWYPFSDVLTVWVLDVKERHPSYGGTYVGRIDEAHLFKKLTTGVWSIISKIDCRMPEGREPFKLILSDTILKSDSSDPFCLLGCLEKWFLDNKRSPFFRYTTSILINVF